MFGNPALNESTFKDTKPAARQMTERGTIQKTALLVLLTALSAANALILMSLGIVPLTSVTIGAALTALVVAIFTVRKPERAVWSGMLYAVLEGVALGGATLAAEQASPGVALPTLVVTFMVVGIMLALWRTGSFTVTPAFSQVMFVAVSAILGTYVFSGLMWALGLPAVWMHANPVLNFVAPVVAALCLFIDFDNVRQGVKNKAPAHMEWYAAFGITVTICWLYIELLGSMSDS